MTTEIELKAQNQLLMQLLTQQTYKAPTGTPSLITAHGNGGLFSPAGLSPGIPNAMLLPNQGLASMLPTRLSQDMNPLMGIFTGVTGDTGDEPEGRCDNLIEAGLSKICTITRPYAWVGRHNQNSYSRNHGNQAQLVCVTLLSVGE